MTKETRVIYLHGWSNQEKATLARELDKINEDWEFARNE